VESRKPERYSSAAPLSPNARLRIVSERVDIFDNLIISVTVGPPSAGLINLKDKSKWTAKSVADSVLAEKSSLVTCRSFLMDFGANAIPIVNKVILIRLNFNPEQ
ncbi:psbP domain-containing protein 5 chloroplastic-like, partial [Trifolium medium]|nr:psbP domain-containing protein 5 chloroplastic-like [Trifolium medium]